MTLRFEAVTTAPQIDELAALADEIWHEYWPARIGQAQTDYMVEKFQSVEALSRDILEGDYRYYLAFDEENHVVGYTGACAEDFRDDPLCDAACVHGQAIAKAHPARLFISKIYLLKSERGKHYASRIIEFWEQQARAEGLTALYLTVNKENELAIRAYLGRGFEIIESQAADIGQGFVMDDYIMAKPIA